MTYSYHLKRQTAFLTPSEDTVRLVLSLPVYLIFHYDLLLFGPNTADFVTVIISAQMRCYPVCCLPLHHQYKSHTTVERGEHFPVTDISALSDKAEDRQCLLHGKLLF